MSMMTLPPVSHTAARIRGRRLIAFPALVAPAMTAARLAGPAASAPEKVQDGSALAHDARNALASLELLGGLLEEPGLLTSGNERLAGDMAEVIRRISTLVGEMAHSVQPGAGHAQELRENAPTLNAALERSRRVLTLTAGARVALHLSAESGLPPLALDDSSLERVLVNLVKNAAEAMPDGGAVRITARRALSRTQPAVLLHVSDDGPGIPAHALAHIFKPGFSSKRNTRPWQVECGLGLTIVKQMVEAADGRIEVASTRRRGTTFELRIPFRSAADVAGGGSNTLR